MGGLSSTRKGREREFHHRLHLPVWLARFDTHLLLLIIVYPDILSSVEVTSFFSFRERNESENWKKTHQNHRNNGKSTTFLGNHKNKNIFVLWLSEFIFYHCEKHRLWDTGSFKKKITNKDQKKYQFLFNGKKISVSGYSIKCFLT